MFVSNLQPASAPPPNNDVHVQKASAPVIVVASPVVVAESKQTIGSVEPTPDMDEIY